MEFLQIQGAMEASCLPTWKVFCHRLHTNSRKIRGDTADVECAKVTRGFVDNDNDSGYTGEKDVNKLLGGDPTFDNFTTIVRQMIHVPLAVICLTGDKELHEIIDSSRSGRVRATTDPFYLSLPEGLDVHVIDNCRKDPRTCESKCVLEAPYICFYAGMYLVPLPVPFL
jgi:hypothetical protein